MNITNVAITFDGALTAQDSIALNELRESLEKHEIIVDSQSDGSKTGLKIDGLTLGLTIAGLAISAIGTIVSALSLWGSKRNYSITFKTGETTFAANNLRPKEALAIAEAIKDNAVASDIKVLISRK